MISAELYTTAAAPVKASVEDEMAMIDFPAHVGLAAIEKNTLLPQGSIDPEATALATPAR